MDRILKLFNVFDESDPYRNVTRGFELTPEETFHFQTVLGFSANYRIKYSITCIDPFEFKRAGMFNSHSQKMLLYDFNRNVVWPSVHRMSVFTLKLVYDGRINPSLTAFAVIENLNGEKTLTCDKNLAILSAAIRKQPFSMNGCSVAVADMWLEQPAPWFIERDFGLLAIMYSKEEIEAMANDPTFRAYDEALAVLALKRRKDVETAAHELQFKQSHSTDSYSVETHLAPSGLVIKCELKESFRRGGWRLVGFCKEGGFAEDRWHTTHNGNCVIDSSASQHAPSFSMKPNQNFYYTLFLTNDTEKRDCLRFQIRFPTHEEQRTLNENFERTIGIRQNAPLRRDVNRSISELHSISEGITDLFAAREEVFARIRQRPVFSLLNDKDQAKVLGVVEDLVSDSIYRLQEKGSP